MESASALWMWLALSFGVGVTMVVIVAEDHEPGVPDYIQGVQNTPVGTPRLMSVVVIFIIIITDPVQHESIRSRS